MRDLLSIIQKEELLFCLSYILAGVPSGKAFETAQKCCELEVQLRNVAPKKQAPKVIITGYKYKISKGQKVPVYRFWGIEEKDLETAKSDFSNRDEVLEALEQPINIDKMLNGSVKYLIPDCVYNEIEDIGTKHCNNIMLTASLIWYAISKKRVDLLDDTERNRRFIEEALKMSKDCMPIGEAQKRLVKELPEALDQMVMSEYYIRKVNNIPMSKLLECYQPNKRASGTEPRKCIVGSRYLEEIKGFANMASPVMIYLAGLDQDNPPNRIRCHNTLMDMKSSAAADFGFYDYDILIERNENCPKLPFIYAVDSFGKKQKIWEVEATKLAIADVQIIDPEFKDYNLILALIVYYLEYPIRVNRIQNTKKDKNSA